MDLFCVLLFFWNIAYSLNDIVLFDLIIFFLAFLLFSALPQQELAYL